MACKDCKKRAKLESTIRVTYAEISDILLEDDYSAMKSRLRTLAQRLQHNLPEPPTPERPQILSDDFEPLHFGVSQDTIDS